MHYLFVLFSLLLLINTADARTRIEQKNRIYMAALEKVADDMNFNLTPPIRSCLAKAVAKTPYTVKEAAYQLKTVDVAILQANGVPKEDIAVAFAAVQPCLNMLGIMIPR